MAYDITDYDELQIYVTDGWREWYIPKFRIFMTVDGDFTNLYWTDTEKGASGLTRLLSLDYNDVTFGYIAPSSAGEVVLQIDSYIISAWTNIPTPPPFDPTQTVKQETGDYTLAIGDEFNFIEFTDSGTALEVTVPTNATEPFPIGTWIDLFADTAEVVDIVADTGVTINSLHNFLTLDDEFAQARIIKVGTNEWDLFGDLKRTLDPDASLYIDAIVDTGVSLTDAQITATDNLFVALKAANIYTKIRAMYPMLGGTAAAHKFNAIDPQDTNAAFRLVFTGSPTHASNGITFNGTTQYADTFLNPNTHLTNNDTHICISQSNETNAGVAIGIERNAGTAGFLLAPRTGGFRDSIHYSSAGGQILQVAQASSIGRHISTRTSSTSHKLFTNGSQVGSTIVTASTNWADVGYKFYFGSSSRENVAAAFCACRVNFVSLGYGLTDSDVSAYDTAIAAFNTALGR